jgi:hypothetical protein
MALVLMPGVSMSRISMPAVSMAVAPMARISGAGVSMANGRLYCADGDVQLSQTFEYSQGFRMDRAMAARKISRHIELLSRIYRRLLAY